MAEQGAPAPTPAPVPAGETKTILAVDDSNDVLALAEEYLTGLGYRVILAANADEALAALRRQPEQIDLLFTDLIMPGGMNGLGLAEEVAKTHPDLPVLLTTGYNEDLTVDGPNRPAIDVIGKPYRRSELADRVNAALNSSARTGRRSPSPFGAVEA